MLTIEAITDWIINESLAKGYTPSSIVFAIMSATAVRGVEIDYDTGEFTCSGYPLAG